MIFKKRDSFKKKGVCYFCQQNQLPDYKEAEILRQFISERGKIISRRRTGVCARHQRKLTLEIKRARFLGLLPFVSRI